MAAQPLGHADTALVQRSIDQDVFAAGPVSRLAGSSRRCRTSLALIQLRRRVLHAQGADRDALENVINLLERKGEALARIRRHLQLKALLEIWLYLHVPMTFALLAALTAHIVSVFFYW
jgi:hypothetical protein